MTRATALAPERPRTTITAASTRDRCSAAKLAWLEAVGIHALT